MSVVSTEPAPVARVAARPPSPAPTAGRAARLVGRAPHVCDRGVGEERPTTKDSPNFALTLGGRLSEPGPLGEGGLRPDRHLHG